MTAPLRRRIALLEKKLEAETEAHTKTFDFYRETLCELVEYKLRHEAALAALAGADYFGDKK